MGKMVKNGYIFGVKKEDIEKLFGGKFELRSVPNWGTLQCMDVNVTTCVHLPNEDVTLSFSEVRHDGREFFIGVKGEYEAYGILELVDGGFTIMAGCYYDALIKPTGESKCLGQHNFERDASVGFDDWY